MVESAVKQAYEVAKKRYAAIGVDTDAVLKKLQDVKISMFTDFGMRTEN